MSETAVENTSVTEKSMKELKADGQNNQASANNVANDTKAQVTKDAKKDDPASNTPAGKRRKRPSEVTDSSLVLETPPGSDSNRRQTRSQTRGTPAAVTPPTPAKKPALDKSNASNGSTSKGRRGRPPKITGEADDETKNNEKMEGKKEEQKADKVEKAATTNTNSADVNAATAKSDDKPTTKQTSEKKDNTDAKTKTGETEKKMESPAKPVVEQKQQSASSAAQPKETSDKLEKPSDVIVGKATTNETKTTSTISAPVVNSTPSANATETSAVNKS